MPSLFSAESDLTIASLVFVRAIRQVSEGDLHCICSLYMREYGIVGDVVDDILGKDELAVVFAFQKTHY
jgi:hypothetical protein